MVHWTPSMMLLVSCFHVISLIGARIALLWQHNVNPSYKLASIPRYDDIVRTAGWAGSARAAGRRPAGDGGAPKTARRIREAGAAGPPPTGAFSTLLLQSGLRASTGGVLATKSERKMLASTCLYSLYAWLILCPYFIVASFLAPECRIFSHLLDVHHLLFSRRRQLQQQQQLVKVVAWFLGAHFNRLILQCREACFLAPRTSRGHLLRYTHCVSVDARIQII